MSPSPQYRFSSDKSLLQDRTRPEEHGYLAGYAALIDTYQLIVPLPDQLCFISALNRRYTQADWDVYSIRYKMEQTIEGHLSFALKYEGVNLSILKALFQVIHPDDLVQWVQKEPTGQYSRRIWFLYEWLMDVQLPLPVATRGNFVRVLNPEKQYARKGSFSKRHRVVNNLPGTRDFCPLINRTESLKAYENVKINILAQEKMATLPPHILSRAVAFLLLKDSRASFAIEGEEIGKDRAERWGRAIAEAGRYPLSVDELIRLQKIVIGESPFVPIGLRTIGGFIGTHERDTAIPLPDHISAKWQDLLVLMKGMLQAYNLLQEDKDIDPVLVAAMISFGFVFFHPFVDGNGRIHRYLIHHVLADLGFTPKGVIFPISAVILKHIEKYKNVLESYSRPRLHCIKWSPTRDGNVDILNETIDLYRYFDATKMAEFLYDCVHETIESEWPEEVDYLEKYDQTKSAISALFEMPDSLISLLILFLQQNKGKLSQRAKKKEFNVLTEKECAQLEEIYHHIWMAPLHKI